MFSYTSCWTQSVDFAIAKNVTEEQIVVLTSAWISFRPRVFGWSYLSFSFFFSTVIVAVKRLKNVGFAELAENRYFFDGTIAFKSIIAVR